MNTHRYSSRKRRRRDGFLNAAMRVLRAPVHFLYYKMQTRAGKIGVFATAGAVLTAIILLIALPGANGEAAAMTAPKTLSLPNAQADANSLALDIAVTPTPDANALLAASSQMDEPEPTPDPSLYEGVEDSEKVTELQERLMELGYLDIDEPTLHFGPATKNAVKLFQRQHDLEQDGIAGANTLEFIYSAEAKKYTLLEGTKGTDVDNFQRQLKDLGYLSKVTGYYGDETVAAVKSFQKENGLSADGKAGAQTFDRINSDKAKASPAVAKQTRSKANVDTMIATAKKQLGKKYVLGNVGPKSFDCSGLVYYCLKEAGSNRRRLNAAGYSQVSDWEKIKSYSGLKRGDLIFFQNNARTKVGHVGIYIGGGEMIDASSANGKVVRRSINTSYWKSHFVCGRRPW
ncbi:peptidoglycan-binding protein [Christensenellaceae bacterium OttesenSCG-928-M15]|nr:peptidoglycan-binding protein [Christensenellaceae bacterium OttesenSCG-928-M15]